MSVAPAESPPGISPASGSRFDTVIEFLFAALLVFMPFALGVVEAWSELVVVALAGAMAICWLAKRLLSPSGRLIWSVAYVPIILFLFMAVGQLIPLPSGLVGLLSPATMLIRRELLGGLSGAAEKMRTTTLSFYPAATLHDLRMILVAAVVFVVVLNVYQSPRQIKRLLAIITAIGAAVGMLALAQDFSGAQRIYWRIPIRAPAHAGPFISHTHFGQFMNLSIGAALGLLLILVHERRTRRTIAARLALGATIVLGAATICLSLTRGGMISMLIAAAVTGVLLLPRLGVRRGGWVAVAVALITAGLLYPQRQSILARLATLHQTEEISGRWQLTCDVFSVSQKFPLSGVGLGAHEVVFPMFDQRLDPSVLSHAENEYAQAAEEMGWPGSAMVLAFGTVVAAAYVRNIGNLSAPARYAALGLGYGLLAIAIHSFTDFGQHLPANFCLTAVFCALLIGMAARRQPDVLVHAAVSRLVLLRAACLGGAVLLWAWALFATNAARRAEAIWWRVLGIESDVRNNDWHGTDLQYADLLAGAQRAHELQPDDITYRHWLNVYRWHFLTRHSSPSSGKVMVTASILDQARSIVGDFQQGLWLCPTYGPSWLMMGQIERDILEMPEGAAHIRTAYSLARSDPTTCLVLGRQAAREGDWTKAVEALRRAGIMDVYLQQPIVRALIDEFHRPDLVPAVASGDIHFLLLYAVPALGSKPEYAPYRQRARNEAIALMEAQCAKPLPAGPDIDIMWHAHWLWMLGQEYLADGRYSEAADLLARALAIPPNTEAWRAARPGWRVVRARALAGAGRKSEAIEALRSALEENPQEPGAVTFLKELETKALPASQK